MYRGARAAGAPGVLTAAQPMHRRRGPTQCRECGAPKATALSVAGGASRSAPPPPPRRHVLMITELASRGASQVGAGDLAILAEQAAAHRAAVLDGDDERDDQPVEAESGPKGPNEHHANVELGLPRGILHANLARHAHGQAGRQVAQPDRQPRAEVGVAGEERVGGRAVLWRGDVGGDDHRDDEAKDAADTREDDGHDGLHHHLGLHLVARQFGDGGEADG
mmetsp:Transcript_33988/g.109132  ORF Transcript_33988/g.109132 Transcript_33988/m.109132 type:complete len:222 (-) Transcript_33988:176-841(-)